MTIATPMDVLVCKMGPYYSPPFGSGDRHLLSPQSNAFVMFFEACTIPYDSYTRRSLCQNHTNSLLSSKSCSSLQKQKQKQTTLVIQKNKSCQVNFPNNPLDISSAPNGGFAEDVAKDCQQIQQTTLMVLLCHAQSLC